MRRIEAGTKVRIVDASKISFAEFVGFKTGDVVELEEFFGEATYIKGHSTENNAPFMLLPEEFQYLEVLND